MCRNKDIVLRMPQILFIKWLLCGAVHGAETSLEGEGEDRELGGGGAFFFFHFLGPQPA